MPSLNRHDIRAALIRANNFARPAHTASACQVGTGLPCPLLAPALRPSNGTGASWPSMWARHQYSVNGGSGLQAGPQC